MEITNQEKFNAILQDFQIKKKILRELPFKDYVKEVEENNSDLQPFFESYFHDIFLYSDEYWLGELSMRKLFFEYKVWNDTYRKKCTKYLYEGGDWEYQVLAFRIIEQNDVKTEDERDEFHYKVLCDSKEAEEERGIKEFVLGSIIYKYSPNMIPITTIDNYQDYTEEERWQIIVERGEKYYRQFLKNVGATADPLSILKI